MNISSISRKDNSSITINIANLSQMSDWVKLPVNECNPPNFDFGEWEVRATRKEPFDNPTASNSGNFYWDLDIHQTAGTLPRKIFIANYFSQDNCSEIRQVNNTFIDKDGKYTTTLNRQDNLFYKLNFVSRENDFVDVDAEW